MATPAPPPSPQAGNEYPEQDKVGLVETVRNVIADELGKLFSSGKADVKEGTQPAGQPVKPPDIDIEGQVRKAVETVHAAEQAKMAGDEEKNALKTEVERLKALIEKPPDENRGWRSRMWD
jgi:hypothetical protein